VRWLPVLTFAAAIGSGLVAGVFFGFSSFVMKALGRLPTGKGVEAMQSINIAAVTPAFMLVFMGTALAALALGVAVIPRLNETGARLVLAGGLIYLIGVFGVTVWGNVPMNDALAKLSPGSQEAATYWPRYLSGWSLWNHARTAASLLSLVLYILALRIGNANS